MTSVGETLRRERLRRGFELEQISRELKISSRFLEAIEVDDFKKLPGGVFAKSFVRQYARLLCLDEEELAGEVQRLVEPETVAVPIAEQPRLVVPEIHLSRVEEWKGAGERRSFLPALAMVVVVMLLCSGIYSWWQRKSQQVSAHEQTATVTRPAPAATVAEVRPPVRAPQPEIQESPAAAASPESGPATAVQPPPVRPTGTNSADRPAADPRVLAPAITRPAVTTAAESGTAVRVAQPGKGPVRLELTADEPVWVLAQANGKFLFSGTIDARQTRTVEANGTLVLRLGNAGGISFKLNGKQIGTVGPKGQVRTVQFTSGGFQIVAAPRPALLDPLDPL